MIIVAINCCLIRSYVEKNTHKTLLYNGKIPVNGMCFNNVNKPAYILSGRSMYLYLTTIEPFR